MKRFSFLNLVFYMVGISLALFFAGFGVHVLIVSYALEHPGYFIIFFFTSNFIILLSVTVLIALGFRLYRHLKPPSEEEDLFSDDSENR